MSQFQFADEKPKDTPEAKPEKPVEPAAETPRNSEAPTAPAPPTAPAFSFAEPEPAPVKTAPVKPTPVKTAPITTADTPKTPLAPTVAGAPDSAPAKVTPSGQTVQNTAVRHPPAPAVPQTPNVAARTSAPQAPTPPPVPTRANAPVAPIADSGAANTPQAPTAPKLTPAERGTPGMMKRNDEVIMLESKTTWDDIYLKIEPAVFWIFRVGAIVSALSLLYILFAIFGGGAGEPITAEAGSAERAAQFANDINTVSRIFQVLFLFTMFALALMLSAEKWIGAALAVAGVVLAFGAPIVFKGIGETPAMALLSAHMRQTGFTLLIIGLIKYGFDLYRWFIELPERAKAKATVGNKYKAEPAQARIAEKATMLSPCWNLPFCREVIRNQCPAFLAKKRCWKFGRGCYCDEEMVARIIRGESLDRIKAPTRQSQAGKPPCGGCHIYLEHQSLKYKMLSPLAVPLTGLAAFLLWTPYSAVFNAGANRLDSLWARMSFDASAMAPKAIATEGQVESASDAAKDAFGSMTPDQMQHWALVMFGVILGFFLLIYVSKAIEGAIYKLGW